MKYSFLVPIYNGADAIRRCLNSLLWQTYRGEYEIVVYDDGSTDNTDQIVSSYAAQNKGKIRLVTGEKNIGLALARVALIEQAVGERVIFVDADDYVEWNLLECVHRAFQQGQSVDIVVYDFVAEYEFVGKHVVKKVISAFPEECLFNHDKKELWNKLYSGQINSIWRKAFQRELFDVQRAKKECEGLSIAEDLYFSMMIFEKARAVYYLHKGLYRYVQVKSSMTHTAYTPEKVRSVIKVMELFYDQINRNGDARNINANTYVLNLYWRILLRIKCSGKETDKRTRYREYDEIREQKSFNHALNIVATHDTVLELLKTQQYPLMELYLLPESIVETIKGLAKQFIYL